MGKKFRSLGERFWSKVDKSEGPESCWPWTASKRGKSIRLAHQYGQFKITTEGRSEIAHRMAYMLHNDLTIGSRTLEVCHTCDNPICCNPKNKCLGSRSDNMRDSLLKCRKGLRSKQGVEIETSLSRVGVTSEEVEKAEIPLLTDRTEVGFGKGSRVVLCKRRCSGT